ncbi:MAG: glycerol kinase GlpK [Bacteroidia bacterium]|nr:glycerol kinase GlpK [Bacteroidia bacterium]MDW8158778.1 glycerol kinase GlpK [Bacteroidia bacterium]
MKNEYILCIDEGTSSARALLLNLKGEVVALERKAIETYYPFPDWVEQDPEAIWQAQFQTIQKLLSQFSQKTNQIIAAGITNQRETTIIWNKNTGKPIYPAIVWQDRRGLALCEKLKDQGYQQLIQQKTGLILDSYFSATKIAWILQNVPEAQGLAQQGALAFGTIDTWLLWKLTGNHYTDPSNASRTLLYNIYEQKWDEELLYIFDIPASILPTVLPSNALFGYLKWENDTIPITGVLGDQQAATFGQQCWNYGDTKNTYGTGCFLVTFTGKEPIKQPPPGILTTVAWHLYGKTPMYALEGSILNAGASLQWLQELGIIPSISALEQFITPPIHSQDLFFVPALTGLGAPYWDAHARGLIIGITRATQKRDLIHAALAAMAFQTHEILLLIQTAIGTQIHTLKADGGVAQNAPLMQFQADLSACTVQIPDCIEVTALGVGYMAALGAGIYTQEDITQLYKFQTTFEPNPHFNKDFIFNRWKQAVERAKSWIVG